MNIVSKEDLKELKKLMNLNEKKELNRLLVWAKVLEMATENEKTLQMKAEIKAGKGKVFMPMLVTQPLKLKILQIH